MERKEGGGVRGGKNGFEGEEGTGERKRLMRMFRQGKDAQGGKRKDHRERK